MKNALYKKSFHGLCCFKMLSEYDIGSHFLGLNRLEKQSLLTFSADWPNGAKSNWYLTKNCKMKKCDVCSFQISPHESIIVFAQFKFISLKVLPVMQNISGAVVREDNNVLKRIFNNFRKTSVFGFFLLFPFSWAYKVMNYIVRKVMFLTFS